MIARQEQVCTFNGTFEVVNVLNNLLPAFLYIILPTVSVANNCSRKTDGKGREFCGINRCTE